MVRKSLIDAEPLIHALSRIRDAGRKRKLEDGIDDVAVQYARLAAAALAWMDADALGELEEAQRLLDQVHQLVL